MKIVKRMFCKHDYSELAASYLENAGCGILRQRYLWRCRKCGKIKSNK